MWGARGHQGEVLDGTIGLGVFFIHFTDGETEVPLALVPPFLGLAWPSGCCCQMGLKHSLLHGQGLGVLRKAP